MSVPLWTVRCGQRTKQSRLRRRSARRNQSISSNKNKWKNAADELLFIRGRTTSLERLGKSSPTGFYGFVNVVWWETANSYRSCNVSQRSVWISGQYVNNTWWKRQQCGVETLFHPRNENPGLLYKVFAENKRHRKTHSAMPWQSFGTFTFCILLVLYTKQLWVFVSINCKKKTKTKQKQTKKQLNCRNMIYYHNA